MPIPTEHKTVQARILAYAEAIGWPFVSREEAERRRGIAAMTNDEFRMTNASLFFDDLLDAKVREFNPRYAEEKRERDLILIDSKQKKEACHG